MKTFAKYVLIVAMIVFSFVCLHQYTPTLIIHIQSFILYTAAASPKYNPAGVDYHRVLTKYKSSPHPARFSPLLKSSEILISRIRDRCRAQNISTEWSMDLIPLPKPRMLLLRSEPENLLYASNPKTGCTSFRVFLFMLDGVSMKKIGKISMFEGYQKHYQVIKYEQVHPGLGYMACDLLKIGVIRNPLTRLVSGFRDKQLRKSQWLTPGVDYPVNSTEVDIFKLFVDRALPVGGAAENIHFTPQWEQMEVCRWPYDLLIPFEDEGHYMDLIQDITSTTRIQYPKSRSSRGLDTHDSTYHARQLYSQLNSTQMEYIYKLYEMDFTLLGYTKFDDLAFPRLTNGMLGKS